MFQRHTSRAIIIQDGKVLMFERWRRSFSGKQLHYFSIPGGGIERGETPEVAVVRELKEEMMIDIEPIRLLSTQISRTRVNYYFLCKIRHGTPLFNLESEEGSRSSKLNRYEVSWVVPEGLGTKVKHDEYRQLFERFNELLASPSPIDMKLH